MKTKPTDQQRRSVIDKINERALMKNRAFSWTLDEVRVLQNCMSMNGGRPSRALLAFKTSGVSSDELLHVWLPFAERMAAGEDVVKQLEKEMNYPKEEFEEEDREDDE